MLNAFHYSFLYIVVVVFIIELIEGMERLVIEEYNELEVEMQFKWKQPKVDSSDKKEATATNEPAV